MGRGLPKASASAVSGFREHREALPRVHGARVRSCRYAQGLQRVRCRPRETAPPRPAPRIMVPRRFAPEVRTVRRGCGARTAMGDWCSGNTWVSKTRARGSIPRSPARCARTLIAAWHGSQGLSATMEPERLLCRLWTHGLPPARRRTPPAPAMRISLTISGANSPCSTTPGVPLRRSASCRADLRPARDSRRSGSRPGSCRHPAACASRAQRASGCAPNLSTSSGHGRAESRDLLLGGDDHDERRAQAATIFSRVCAPPPPLTSHPSGSTWSAPSIAMSSSAHLVELLDGQPEIPGDLCGRRGGRDKAGPRSCAARSPRALSR